MSNPLSAYDFVYKAVVDAELQKRIKQLEELVEFHNRMRENRY